MAAERAQLVSAALAAVAILAWARRRRGKKPVLAIDFDEVCVGCNAPPQLNSVARIRRCVSRPTPFSVPTPPMADLPAFITFNNAVYGTTLKLEDFTSYMFWEVPGCKLATREEATARVYEFHASAFFGSVQPIPGAFKGLRDLAKRFELHVVTSRQNDIAQQTRECINTYFPGVFSGVHFGNHFGTSGAKVSKPEMCARIGAVALVDDSLDYARQCAKAGIRTYLFGDYNWNRSDEKLDASLVVRVADWDALGRQL